MQNIQNLEGAVVMTKKRIASNYRLAVPQFYNKKIQLLIPLYRKIVIVIFQRAQ
ncbi:MAG: DUF3825 domain-containing protein [Dethiobacteria bacterium]